MYILILKPLIFTNYLVSDSLMKSKQSLFEQIIEVSTRKSRQVLNGERLQDFQSRMKLLPAKIKELDASPYMFIFDALIEHKQCVDYVITQYLNLIEENFLNPDLHASTLVQHFRKNLDQNSFMIIQILMKIKNPNLTFFQFFFEVQKNIAMPDNVLENFKYTGYRWLSRCFAFKKCPRPSYIDDITGGLIQSEKRNLPSIDDEKKSLEKYVGKIVTNMAIKIDLELSEDKDRKKFRYGACFMCEKGADYYCKDTKIPVCGSECKKAHINYISNNPSIDFLYSKKTQQKFQELLIKNLATKTSLALSTDYLCSIYTNSDYAPYWQLPHKHLLTSPIIIERVWLLYLTYYQKKGDIFQHIFADSLKSHVEYIKINAAKYFLKIADTNRIFEVYESLDDKGFRRIFPIIIDNMDSENKIAFIYKIINNIYSSINSANKLPQYNSKHSLLRIINYEKDPLTNFIQHLKQQNNEVAQKTTQVLEEYAMRKISEFMIKNEQQINKNKLCEIISKKDNLCLIFLQELLLTRRNHESQCFTIKNYRLIDEILREIFYFINMKVSDQVYNLLEILWNIINPEINPPNFPELADLFGPANTNQKDTLFRFSYLIIMLVTQLHKGNERQKSTCENFINRVKDFDAVFVEKNKKYITQVYHRLLDLPFSQEYRGVLVNYAIVKNRKSSEFNPSCILIDNWQMIYEAIMGINNETNFLYRCCQILISFPPLCHPFMQLLLNKVDPSDPEEHLIASINGIMQQQPNAAGSSWKQIFYRNPKTNKYLFDLSAVIHFSKSLNIQHFHWFIRQFSQNVKLSQNMDECVKLLAYNNANVNIYKKDEKKLSQFQQKVQILNKETVQLFSRQLNTYFQLQFIKQIFRIGNFDLGVILLDIMPVNIVTGNLIIFTLVAVIKENFKQINKYQPKKRKQISKQIFQKKNEQNSQLQKEESQSAKNIQQKTNKINKIWSHILNKVLTIHFSNPHSQQNYSFYKIFEETLRNLPGCEEYFQTINIDRAIGLSYISRDINLQTPYLQNELTIVPQIHQQLRVQLDKFTQHFPQMNEQLLQQFVNKQNLETIVNHFYYFCKMNQTYQLFSKLYINGQDLKHVKFQKIFQAIIKYKNKSVKNSQSEQLIEIEELPNFSSFLIIALFSLNKSQNHQLMSQFQIILQQILDKRLKNMLKFVLDSLLEIKKRQFSDATKKVSDQLLISSKILSNLFSTLNHAASTTLSHAEDKIEIINILMPVKSKQTQEKYTLIAFITEIFDMLQKINNSYQLRIDLWEIQPFKNMSLPPCLIQQQSACETFLFHFNFLKVQALKSEKQAEHALINLFSFLQAFISKNCRAFLNLKQLLQAKGTSISPKKNSNISNQQKLKQNTSLLETQLINQQLKYTKLTLQKMIELLTRKNFLENVGNNENKEIQQVKQKISNDIFAMVHNGFDNYSVDSKKFIDPIDPKNKAPLLFKIYESINQIEKI